MKEGEKERKKKKKEVALHFPFDKFLLKERRVIERYAQAHFISIDDEEKKTRTNALHLH